MDAETNRQDNVAALNESWRADASNSFQYKPPLVCHGHFHAKVCPQENPGHSSIAAVSDIAKNVSDTHLFRMK